MARIIDKDTRLIDIDFSQIKVAIGRSAGSESPDGVTVSGPGQGQLLHIVDGGQGIGGSFIQYVRLDLSYMTKNNEVMLPVEASIQRTSPVPLGFNNNGNNFDQIEEYIYVLSRPLNNTNLAEQSGSLYYETLRQLGLNGSSPAVFDIAGKAGYPDQQQTIYAEKRMYSYNSNLGASQANGELIANPGASYNTLQGMPVLDSVTTWGSMSSIVGPNMHVYRVVINRTQSFPGIPDTFTNIDFEGFTDTYWPAVSIRFLCKDPNFTEGEYLTRIANAMNNTAEGGPTA